ncbi:hypothetical protein [uncultured Enterococcus sp.]|uniref:hypothetical protein n=1 Tax=uncultured Enterococcus sp. TaxID=167972 RepID=UPI0025F45169|nr:hypothetical protein [uncultured Enterococcus sp.]
MKKRWYLYTITGLCALTLSACSHEQQAATSSDTTTTSSNMTSTSESNTTATYTMQVKENGTNDQVLVTMDPTSKENQDQTVLGDQQFEGYLLLQDVTITDKDDNKLTVSQLKAGDQLTVTLTDTPIIARSLPPKIAGASIKSIVLN